jgi:methionine aminopeptidase
MVLAVESISVMGPTNEYQISKDRWTVYTKNKKYLSGLYEHTVIVTENGPEIITKF